MAQRRTIVFETSATATSGWFTLDYKYDENPERGFFLTMASVSNQNMILQVGASVPDANGAVDHVYNVSTYSNLTSADGVMTGNWPVVRVIFECNGAAKFVMLG